MKEKNLILKLTSILLIFFLFIPVVIRSVYAYTDGGLKRVGLTKTSGPTKADSQLLFEEKEKEEKKEKEKEFDSIFTNHYLLYIYRIARWDKQHESWH